MSEPSAVNEALLRQVWASIVEENHWDQGAWCRVADGQTFDDQTVSTCAAPDCPHHQARTLAKTTPLSCGTNMCLAGHTVLTAGDKILVYVDEDGDPEEGVNQCVDATGELHGIELRARHLLGLTLDQAVSLFDSEADLAGLDWPSDEPTAEDRLHGMALLIRRVTGIDVSSEVTP